MVVKDGRFTIRIYTDRSCRFFCYPSSILYDHAPVSTLYTLARISANLAGQTHPVLPFNITLGCIPDSYLMERGLSYFM